MTEEQKQEYHSKVNENIEKYGYHMTFVFESDNPSFCYSTGIFKNFGIPEIFISSLPQNLSFELVHNYVDIFSKRTAIPFETKIENLTDRFPVYLIKVSNSKLDSYILSTRKFYSNQGFEYLQLIYPDTKGHFPNDLDYNYDQEILGNFKI